MTTIGILGSGSWGTALAFQLARANPNASIYLWGHNPDKQKKLIQDRCNAQYFPEYPFPENLLPVVELTDLLKKSECLVLAIPSYAFSDLMEEIFKHEITLPILSTVKGLSPDSAELLHTIVQSYAGTDYPFAVLSGPSFATEVMANLPTAVTIASEQLQQAEMWQRYFHSDYFRVYTTDDIIGVQLGGAVKNVLAIATGIADGLGFGANARAALITRGLAEMMRLNQALGGKQTTMTGLAGVGDLVLTCTDNQSRNRRFGIALGSGKTIKEAQTVINRVVEGYQTTKLLNHLKQLHHIEMPICEAVYAILYKNIPIPQVMQELLARSPKGE
jgi:glycerol-3-phosphate dehydrogenase (NAD(P)+)